MNGYDFDDTIFKGNSLRRFYFYCLIRLPYLALYLPAQLIAAVLYGIRVINKNRFLCALERFIIFVPCKEKFIERFWNKNFKRIKSWYLDQKRDDDIILSASPEYLVKVACDRLGVKCIASQVNVNTGKTIGRHCHGVSKIGYYKNRFGDAALETFYSDSLTDAPMMKLAKCGYLVDGDKITLLYKNGYKISDSNIS